MVTTRARIGRTPAGLMAGLLALAASLPVVAQSPVPPEPGPLCLLTLDELNEATGLAFASVASGPESCTYDSDPTVDLYTVDLRIELPDPAMEEIPEDGLWRVRGDYDVGGRDLTVGGFPAWESDDGLWVDIGDSLFVAQPILFFASTPIRAQDILVPIVELALTRLPPGSGGAP